MKKLMIAAFAIAFAAVAQAASVTWKVGGIQINGDWDAQDGDLAAGYLVCLFDNSTFSQADLASSLTTADWQASFNNKIASYIGNDDGAGVVGGIALANEGDFNGYMVILDAGSIDTAENAFVTDIYTAKDNSTHQLSFNAFDDGDWVNATGSWTKLGAESVPEPTSALMLLVGLAGLALKRKVA